MASSSTVTQCTAKLGISFARAWGSTSRTVILDFVLDGRKRCDILRHFLGDLSELELENYGQIKDGIVQSMQLEIVPIPGVLRLLRELAESGIALAVVTSASRGRTFITLGQLDVKELFSVVITGEDVIAGKPDPAGYQMALDRLQ